MFQPDLAQLSQLQCLQKEAVRASALEEVAHFLLQFALACVPVSAEDGYKDVGVSTRPWFVACRHDDLILDQHQALDLTGEALCRFSNLKYLEVLPLPLEGDEAVTVKEVPGRRMKSRSASALETLAQGSIASSYHFP